MDQIKFYLHVATWFYTFPSYSLDGPTFSGLQVTCYKLHFGMGLLSIFEFILSSMHFLLSWFLIHTSSNLVRSQSLVIGLLVKERQHKVVQMWLITALCGLYWGKYLQDRELCLACYLALFSSLLLVFSSTYMGGYSYTRHCCTILLVQIQDTTSLSISITYISIMNRRFQW